MGLALVAERAHVVAGWSMPIGVDAARRERLATGLLQSRFCVRLSVCWKLRVRVPCKRKRPGALHEWY